MDFFSLKRNDIEELCLKQNIPAMHTKTLMRNAYKALNDQPWMAKSLPNNLQHSGGKIFSHPRASISQAFVSRYDSTVKFIIRLEDSHQVECVLMPEKRRVTLCLSTQVGCAQACTFCQTGRMGLIRQLTAGEIVSQLWLANRWIEDNPGWRKTWQYQDELRISNIVFMGMGEPLDNPNALIDSIDIMTDPFGFNLSPRRIAVSTAGHLDGLKQLIREKPDVSLALSLHASSDSERTRLMPINRKWPVAEVLNYLREFYEKYKSRKFLLIQYTVIAGVNDSAEHAERIIKLLEGIPTKINLIPLNEIKNSRFKSPDQNRLFSFRDRFHEAGLRVMIRYSKGQDISAACGQLITDNP